MKMRRSTSFTPYGLAASVPAPASALVRSASRRSSHSSANAARTSAIAATSVRYRR